MAALRVALRHQANVNAVDEIGNSPLQLAIATASLPLMEALLSAGADVNRPDIRGRLALHQACRLGLVQQTRRLLETGACNGLRAMHIATQHAFTDSFAESIFELLLSAGAYIDPGVEWGWTPLHAACRIGNWRAASRLIEAGADLFGQANMVCYLLPKQRKPVIKAPSKTPEGDQPNPTRDPDAATLDEVPALLTSGYVSAPLLTAASSHHDETPYTALQAPSAGSSYAFDIPWLRATPKRPILKPKDPRGPTEDKHVLAVEAHLLNNSRNPFVIRKEAQQMRMDIFQLLHLMAVKQIRRELLRAKTPAFRFTKEVTIMARLQHPCIVALRGICVPNPALYLIILEYVEAGSLNEFLYKNEQIERPSLKDALIISHDVASALMYIHNLKYPIVHRDVSSSNILLRANGHACLSDFGESAFCRTEEDGRARQRGIFTKQPGPLGLLLMRAALASPVVNVALAATAMAYENRRPWLDEEAPAVIVRLIMQGWAITFCLIKIQISF
ncbi:uncharacterized protein MONBRDRAFT_29025 [Monosiga brevicollis MX1]|uniref:Protein kinase domain-containing protein n=1 Tax=Monosiga brevicollis TaxID=81824 RepID=A9V9W2_MONBE|nr:uncharacterized protein MONBRDRAFT_29025 [Monosiga brevicollis MX1]EDQ85625.1 predicted protein [Monosiga brevicollis MX1]|eukprot:XP_001749574.1 hypothetical protein [Monosiga brevicollis MX1]